MAEGKIRVRVVFEDRRILSKSQRTEGLTRSWVVLNPQRHPTISDFSGHLVWTFKLFDACPYGISLSMDGFVLPPFESSYVLKDNDIVCVKTRKTSMLEIVGTDDVDDVSDLLELGQRHGMVSGVRLLANKEIQEETGGYENESEQEEEEEEPKEMQNVLVEKKSSKKRKATSKIPSSKKKKSKLDTDAEDRENGVSASKSKKNTIKKGKKADKDKDDNDGIKSMIKLKKCSKEEGNDLLQMSNEAEKMPSRSARRKKAKRKWLREKALQEKQELEQKQLIETPIGKSISIVDNDIAQENHLVEEEHEEATEQGDDVGNDIVPVEVRPGHIRFKPFDGTHETLHENEAPMEIVSWNGITSKKKGQKWGKEKTVSAKRYGQDFSEALLETENEEVEKSSIDGHIDFKKLQPYNSSPKEGDIVAYRMIELSSSWTPEISSFRVGQITRYDQESKKVILIPVSEFPIEGDGRG